MTWDHIRANWAAFRGRARERWDRLTDDDLNQAEGRAERIEGKLQMRYGQTREEAMAEMDDFRRRCSAVS